MNRHLLKLALFLLLFQFLSCEKEPEIVTEPTIATAPENAIEKEEEALLKAPFTMQSVDKEGIPEITNFLSSKVGKDLFKKGATTHKEGNLLIDDDILMVTDSLGVANYSFRFTYANGPENEFYNLVVGKSLDGKPQEPQVYHYVCDPEYYEDFKESGFDPVSFVGTLSVYPFTSVFKNSTMSRGTCTKFDQYGDPIPCVRTRIINGSRSSGRGSSMGGAPSNGGFARPTLASYSLTVSVYHVTPDGRTFAFGSGSTCKHKGRCQVIYQVSNSTHMKKEAKGCSGCPISSGGVVLNTGSRAKHLVNVIKGKIGLSYKQVNFLLKNPSLVHKINKYLRHNESNHAKEFIKWVLILEMKPDVPCGIRHDCVRSIKEMANGLRKFHGKEGKLMADYFDSLIVDLNSFSKSDLQEFYDMANTITRDYNNRMQKAITGAYKEGVTLILEIALFEVGGALATKLLRKIPVKWVFRGKVLDKMVKKVELLGVRGTNKTIREVITNAPITKSKELFNMLTKNAITKTVNTEGIIIANIGNGNKIVYRTLSKSNFSATIELTFPKLYSKTRKIKFKAP